MDWRRRRRRRLLLWFSEELSVEGENTAACQKACLSQNGLSQVGGEKTPQKNVAASPCRKIRVQCDIYSSHSRPSLPCDLLKLHPPFAGIILAQTNLVSRPSVNAISSLGSCRPVVLWHDRDPLRVDRAQVRVLKEPHQVGLRCLLQGQDRLFCQIKCCNIRK